MSFLIEIAKAINLDKMTIQTALWIAIPMVSVLYIILKGTIMQLGIRILTKEKLPFGKILVPTILSAITGGVLLFAGYMLLIGFKINTFGMVYNMIMQYDYVAMNLVYIILVFLIMSVVNMFITAYILRLKNIDIYVIIGNGIKNIYRKLLKKEKKDISKEVLTQEDIDKVNSGETQKIDLNEINIYENKPLKYINGFLCALFTFSVLFFVGIIFVFIGVMCGPVVIKILT